MAKNLNNTAVMTIDDTVQKIFGHKKTLGNNGIEIEVEGRNLPEIVGDGTIWNAIHDGSLRGESKEYVFSKPLKEEKVEEALNLLEAAFKDRKSVINNSYRTSVHVHVNVQDLTMKQLYNYICLYIIFEDILIDMCGRERDGNLFCLRVTDAEGLIGSLKEYLLRGTLMPFKGTGLRYASFNINAVGKYGSLEFRAYRGTTDKDDILTWTKLLNCLHDAAKTFDNPQEIMTQFSQLRHEAFTRKVFGANPVSNFILAANRAEERIVFGVRYAQEIAYCVKTWAPTKKKDDNVLYGGLVGAAAGGGGGDVRLQNPFVRANQDAWARQVADANRIDRWAMLQPFQDQVIAAFDEQPDQEEEI